MRGVSPSRAAILLALLALAPACRVADAHAYNLRELHDETGRHKRLASHMSDTEYLTRDAFAGLLHLSPGKVRKKAPEKIADPLEVCVQNLLALEELTPWSERVGALQVECFARIAVQDPWQISRQIAVRSLGAAGARLELGAHPPPAPPPPEAAATPEAVRDALEPLIHAVATETDGAKTDIPAACRKVAALQYDLDGLVRVLPASAFLLERAAPDAPAHKALLELVLDLERRGVRLALEHANADVDPYVRAQALTALVHANGAPYLAQEMPLLGTEPEEVVQLALLRMIRALGLPPARSANPSGAPGGDATADSAQSAREGSLALVYKVATTHPVDRVRVDAMETLGAVSGAGFRSLREEDWQTWWNARTSSAAPRALP